MTTQLFRPDNTSGYTQDELDTLNAEWRERSMYMEIGTDNYQLAADAFCLEVSKR